MYHADQYPTFHKIAVGLFQLIDIVVFLSFFPSCFHLGQGKTVIGKYKFVNIVQIVFRIRCEGMDIAG